MFRCQHHVAGTKQGVGPGGEHRDRVARGLPGPIHHRKAQFGAGGASDPVGLHGAHPLRPALQLGQVIEQGVGVGGDLEKPLAQLALLHQGTGAPGAAFAIHLLIGEHGLVDGIPVDGGVLLVGQAGVEELQEQPLGPAVVIGMAGRQLPAPVDRQAQLAELLAHRGDVLVGPGPWINAPLNRRVFGRQAEGIPAHRMQDPLAPQPLHPGDHIGDHVIAHMAHVQVPRRIGKHRKGVEALLARGQLGRVVQAEALPLLLPASFDRLGLVAAAIAHSANAHCRHGRKAVMVPQPLSAPWPCPLVHGPQHGDAVAAHQQRWSLRGLADRIKLQVLPHQAALQLGARAQLQAEGLLAADPGLELAHPWHGGVQARRSPVKGSPHRINVRPSGP